jgi:beta-1,4-mannosyltransferase
VSEVGRRGIAYFPAKDEPNPYIRLWYGHLEKLGFETVHDGRLDLDWLRDARHRVGFLHFHWNMHWYYEYEDLVGWCPRKDPWNGVASFISLLVAARAYGYRILWTIHELYPHETMSRERDRAATRALVSLSSLLLAHDRATAERTRREFGVVAEPIEIVEHGSYVGFYPRGAPRAAVRAGLEIESDAFVFLALGRIRHYKRLDLLVKAFSGLTRKDVVLVVAGYPQAADVAARIEQAARGDHRIRLLAEEIPEAQVAGLYAASDAAVLARDDGWTSGSLILAISEGVPVIAPSAPAYDALLDRGGAGWFFEPGSAVSLRRALEVAASDPAVARDKGLTARSRAEQLIWSEAAARAAELMTR